MSIEPLVKATEVSKRFHVQGKVLRAVERVSFELHPGKTLGVVGESGSGKSTLGRVVLKLLEADGGSVTFEGTDLSKVPRKTLRQMRRHMQMVFQDPMASLNPRMTVFDAIEDGLKIHGIGKSAAERRMRVEEVLERVGLPRSAGVAYPHELSGGQLQRVGIARALALRPKFVVLDEPVSALDVSIQAQVIQLLRELRDEMQLAYMFISHNLAVVEYLSDEVLVLYLGEVVEQAPVEELFAKPSHPYTQALMRSVLKVPTSPDEVQDLTPISGEIPSPFAPPPGCPFHPRCPVAQEVCRQKKPEIREISPGHRVSCHLA
ncbi:ABC transporter ATP-binding protein [Alicyclobacillus cellulosilyticus]|uniref:ABC transporter ATP-binding protein n=1 Tax=Alicyclobacillus cellulosilyticus TaxID=1003997 RepID=A0A917NGG3_9BACL|nr:ABC transporter ATP-binding protein [Alicyclobacillus cellulosilyticus]GGI98529.1 ABC transporter ATP-binding protein [Alicyclobacillus cellulosilyticus]